MKYLKLSLLLIVSIIISCSDYTVVPPENVNKERLEIAKSISHKLLSGQESKRYYELTNKEATTKMVVGLDQESQRAGYEMISGMHGSYEGLEFYQLLKPKDGTLSEVYRFKGKFSSGVDVEIRTTLDGYGKLAGFYMLKWRDSF